MVDDVHLYSLFHWHLAGACGVASFGRAQRSGSVLLRAASGLFRRCCHDDDGVPVDDVAADGAPVGRDRVLGGFHCAGVSADFRNRFRQRRRALVFLWIWQLSTVRVPKARIHYRHGMVAGGQSGNWRASGQKLFFGADLCISEDGHKLFLNFPRFGRDKVVLMFTKKASACLLDNHSVFSLEKEDLEIGVVTGALSVKALKIGIVSVSSEPCPDSGKYDILFQPFVKDCAKNLPEFPVATFVDAFATFIA